MSLGELFYMTILESIHTLRYLDSHCTHTSVMLFILPLYGYKTLILYFDLQYFKLLVTI